MHVSHHRWIDDFKADKYTTILCLLLDKKPKN